MNTKMVPHIVVSVSYIKNECLEYYLYIECNGLIYGCAACYENTERGNYYQCTKCMDGLYLLANQTYNTQNLPTVFTYCVSDCNKAHHAYINNPFTGECVHCGRHCQSCNLKTGCETCLPEVDNRPYVNLNTGIKYDGSHEFS
jgi:hypothetical protein